MTSITLALPILPGKTEAWRRFCQELSQGRRGQREGLQDALGVDGLRAWLLDTSGSTVALLCLKSDNPEQLLARIAASQHPFNRWLRRELSEIHALELEAGSVGPQMELVFEWAPA